jgi:hypothetical protein
VTADDELPPLSLDEAVRIIARLEEAVTQHKIILIGGQAIALWGAQLADYLLASEDPVTSKDVDFQGDKSTVVLAARLLGGKLFLPSMDDATPQTGMAKFLDSEGYERTLDFLEQPRGLDAEDVRNTAIEVDISLADGRKIPLWVMHPERCLRSRVANTTLPGKDTPLAERQLRAAISLVPAFSRLLLDEGESPRIVMKINERVFDLAYRDRSALRLYLEKGIDVSHAVLEDHRLPEPHLRIRLPQLRARLENKRARLRRVRALRKQ